MIWLRELLGESFIWSESAEGEDYWHKMCKHMLFHEESDLAMSLASYLMEAFAWNQTEESAKYWADIHYSLERAT